MVEYAHVVVETAEVADAVLDADGVGELLLKPSSLSFNSRHISVVLVIDTKRLNRDAKRSVTDVKCISRSIL